MFPGGGGCGEQACAHAPVPVFHSFKSVGLGKEPPVQAWALPLSSVLRESRKVLVSPVRTWLCF